VIMSLYIVTNIETIRQMKMAQPVSTGMPLMLATPD
jgi:hypothetical protein